MYWETNRVSPALRFLPKIIAFLGYDPCVDRQPQSLAEQLKAQRKKLGLSQKKLAGLLGIDQSTLASWERVEHRPTKTSLHLVNEFLSWTTVPTRKVDEQQFDCDPPPRRRTRVRVPLFPNWNSGILAYNLPRPISFDFGTMRNESLRVPVGAQDRLRLYAESV
jgi:transcriptional regulator with XRE-family HTH domain